MVADCVAAGENVGLTIKLLTQPTELPVSRLSLIWRINMSNFALRLPDSLHSYAKKMAQEDNASLNQFTVMAAAEKVSALNIENFFKERAARGSRERFLEIMNKVPDLPVGEGDEVV